MSVESLTVPPGVMRSAAREHRWPLAGFDDEGVTGAFAGVLVTLLMLTREAQTAL